jgi:hypothetical protein
MADYGLLSGGFGAPLQGAPQGDLEGYLAELQKQQQRQRAMRVLSGGLQTGANAISKAWDYTQALPEQTRQQGQEYLVQNGYAPADAERLAGNASRSIARRVAAVDFMTPQSPSDFAFAAAGPLAKVGAKAVKGAMALGGGLLAMDPSEAEAAKLKAFGTFLSHTPSKPNPAVGTRYDREFTGGLADKTPVSIEDLKGSSIQIMPWDSTNRNYKIMGVSDGVLPTPTTTTGGQDFARDLKHIDAEIGGASNKTIATRIQDRAIKAQEENLAAGGNGQVYQLPVTMGARGEDFSTMPTDVLLQVLDARGLTKKKAGEIDREIRAYIPEMMAARGVQPFKEFRGINTPEGRQQLYSGGGGLLSTPGELRKAFVDRMYLKENQAHFGFNKEDITAALTDPALAGVPKGYAGNTVIRAMPDRRLMPSTHPAYDTDFPGLYKGSMANIPVEVLMPKIYAQMQERYKHLQGGNPLSVRAMTLGGLEKRKEGVSEIVDDQTIESVMRYLNLLAPR